MTDKMSDNSESSKYNRRSFLGVAGITVAGAGLATTSVSATGASTETEADTATAVATSQSIVEDTTHYEIEHPETGTTRQYLDSDSIDLYEFPETGHALLRRINPVTNTIESVEEITIPEQSLGAIETDIELSVAPAVVPNSSVSAGEEIDFYISAVDQSDMSGVADEQIDVQIEDDDNEVLTEYSVETDADGYAVVVHETDSTDAGQQRIVAENESGARAVYTYYVGPRYSRVPTSGSAIQDETTTLAVYAADGDVPIDDETVEITIESPSDDETTRSVSIEEGVGTFEFTPEEEGSYWIHTPSDRVRIRSHRIQAAISNNTRTIQNQQSSDSLVIGGQLLDGQEPLAEEDIVVSVANESTSEPVATLETTTESGGQFIVEFEHEDGAEEYYYRIELADGTSVHQTQSNIQIQREVTVDPDPINPSISIDEFSYSPTDEVTASITVTDSDDEPMDGVSGLVSWEVGFNGPRIATSEVTTDDDGEATAAVDLSDITLDNQRLGAYLYILEDELYADDDRVSVESITVDRRTNPSVPGETSSIDFTVTDADTEEPISDEPIALFASQSDLYTGIAATATGTTDADGELTLSYDIPAETPVRTTAWYDAPGSSVSSGTTGSSGPLDLSVSTPNRDVAPGEEIAVELDASGDDGLTALVFSSFNYYLEAQAVTVGDDITVNVPEVGVSDGDWGRVNAIVLSENGALDNSTAFLNVDGDGEEREEEDDEVPPPEADISVRPSDPIATQTIQFDAGDSEPADRIESYEWELGDDDESTDSGEQIQFSYDDEGTYTVTLTVTDIDGETETTTTTVSVDPQPESTEDYADEESGSVESGGVRDAFGHWGSGGIDRDLLREVFAEWQRGDSDD